VVRDAREASARTAELGVRPGLDGAVRADGVAVWLVWREATGPNARTARLALGVFVVHFAVNVAWSAVFFGAQSIVGGLVVIVLLWVVIVLLWVAIVATMVAFARVDRRAALLHAVSRVGELRRVPQLRVLDTELIAVERCRQFRRSDHDRISGANTATATNATVTTLAE
jgi:hypothetical protein